MHALIFTNSVLFLSTLSLRRATIFPPVDTSSVSISIHALLAESDILGNVVAGGIQNVDALALIVEL